MSVDSQYQPVFTEAKGMGADEDRTYHFEIESIGDTAMKMYWVTEEGAFAEIEEYTSG